MLRLVSIGLILWLSGCTSVSPLTPQVTYYLLDDTPQVSQTVQTNTKPINVSRIVVPEYLNRTNLVMRKSNKEMLFANYHSWADSLPQAMQRVLVQNLNETANAIKYTRHCPDNQCAQLRLIVDHFYPTEDGQVVLAGSYFYTKNTSATALEPFVLTRDLENGGYNEAVQRMRELLSDLAKQIEQSQSSKRDHQSDDHTAPSVENAGVVF